MKLISKISIHPLFYIVLFITFITGYLKVFLGYTLIIIVHELGHIFASIILKWKIDKVIIYPFGGMTKFNQRINSSLLEEFLILIYGPLFQILFYKIYPLPYHEFILLFNLLPIYPLDGSKLLYILLNNIVSFYKSFIIIFIISIITILYMLFQNISLINILICVYLLYEVYLYIKNLKNIMLKFYYERYKYPFKYKKNHIIKSLNLTKMYKNRNNYFILRKNIINEYEIFKKRFDK